VLGAARDRVIGHATPDRKAAERRDLVEAPTTGQALADAPPAGKAEPLANRQWDMRQIGATVQGSYAVNTGDKRVLVGVLDLGIGGVAPNVTLVNIRAGQDSGYFFLLPTVEALVYAGDIGVDVVNMSFYTDPWLYNCLANPADSPTEQTEQRVVRELTQRAVNYAMRHGITPIAAMGNEATDLGNTTSDATSPDYPPGVARTRTVDNSCITVPTETRG